MRCTLSQKTMTGPLYGVCPVISVQYKDGWQGAGFRSSTYKVFCGHVDHPRVVASLRYRDEHPPIAHGRQNTIQTRASRDLCAVMREFT